MLLFFVLFVFSPLHYPALDRRIEPNKKKSNKQTYRKARKFPDSPNWKTEMYKYKMVLNNVIHLFKNNSQKLNYVNKAV